MKITRYIWLAMIVVLQMQAVFEGLSYYQILEISPKASVEEITKARRKLSLKYHPDRNPDDPTATEKTQKINEAFEVLSDPQRRAQYDFDYFGSADQKGIENVEFDFKASNQPWQIEIRNKVIKKLYVDIDNGQKRLFQGIPIYPSASKKESEIQVTRFKGLDLNQPVIISIAADNPWSYVAQYEINPQGKNIFLTWENGQLRVQKGTWGKTQSGLSLKNNVTQKDLKKNPAYK